MPSISENELQNAQPGATSTSNAAEDMRHFVHDVDYLTHAIDIRRIESFSFAIDDIPYYVTHKKDASDGESRVCIQAILGYLPYSIEAGDHRQAILTILATTHRLFNVRFGLDTNGRIFAAGNFTTDMLTSPDFIFFPLTRFLQEALPFIELIGQHL